MGSLEKKFLENISEYQSRTANFRVIAIQQSFVIKFDQAVDNEVAFVFAKIG
jgi:hypothetical protein